METNLIKFMEYITPINKDISIYKDEEKGVLFYMNTIQLLSRVEYLELSKEEYKKSKFEMLIDDIDYNEITVKRPVPKYSITKNKADEFTLTDAEIKVKQIWNVSNALKIKKSFNNKEEALKFADEINSKIVDYFK